MEVSVVVPCCVELSTAEVVSCPMMEVEVHLWNWWLWKPVAGTVVGGFRHCGVAGTVLL